MRHVPYLPWSWAVLIPQVRKSDLKVESVNYGQSLKVTLKIPGSMLPE